MPIPSPLALPERKSLREVVEAQIRDAIFDGTLQPGENLNDSALQEWLGVSRTPIREALSDLARVGLIEMSPQRYTRVAQPRPEDRTNVLQTLGALIGGVVRVTVPTLTAAQKQQILTETTTLISVVGNRDAHEHGRQAWVMIDQFINFCQNPLLVRATHSTVQSLAFQLSSTRTNASTNWASLDEGYPALHSAVTDGDAIEAELAIERIFRLSTKLLLAEDGPDQPVN